MRRDKGLCQCDDCKRKAYPLPAHEVDHIVSKKKAEAMGWTKQQINADSNLQAINRDCHKKKTAEENGKRLKPQIGVDGWPIE
jgi:5-methylcytosine-specific restriction protein A